MAGVWSARTETVAKLACAYAGLAWGLFWLPLRALDAAGVQGAWATALFYLLPLAVVCPLFVSRWNRLMRAGWRLQLTAIMAAGSLVLYAEAFLFTDVIRAMLLYYMTPVWSSLLARVWLKEPITLSRILAIALGLAGMLVIFGIDLGPPVPRNLGDWIGLAAGLLWAVAAVLMRRDIKGKAVELSLAYFFWGGILALAIALLPFVEAPQPPSIAMLAGQLWWLAPVVLVLVVPAVYAVMWGTPKLNPGTVGILFMTEISVGAMTAWLWAGEPFGLRELSGVVLITVAGLAEVLTLPIILLRRNLVARRL